MQEAQTSNQTEESQLGHLPKQTTLSEQCLLHDKAADLICLHDQEIICCSCALFGEHKGHEVINSQGILSRITEFTENCLNIYEHLQDITHEFNYQLCRQNCENKLQNKKESLMCLIGLKFDELEIAVKTARKITVMKIQKQYSNSLQKLESQLQLVQLSGLDAQITDWYSQIEQLGVFMDGSMSVQELKEAVKYIDGGEHGEKIINEGQGLINQLRYKQSAISKVIEGQQNRVQVKFEDKWTKEIEKYCQIVDKCTHAAKQSAVDKEADDNLLLSLTKQSTMGYDGATGDGIRGARVIAQENEWEPVQIRILKQHNETEQYQTAYEIDVCSLPHLSISQIKPNKGMSSNGSSDRNRFMLKESRVNIPGPTYSINNQQKKRKKLDFPDKYKGIVEDLKCDRAETIDLTAADLGDSNIFALCPFIRKSRRIKVLKLIKNKISEQSLTELLTAVADSKISSLNLSQNSLTEKCVQLIQSITAPSLKTITLTLNKINRRSVKNKVEEIQKKTGISLLL